MLRPTVLHHLALLQTFLFLTACNEGETKNVNFHNIGPPLDPTPFPRSIKCFTCENATDNYSCNRWAEDKWCPQNSVFCMTVHHFSLHGRSQSVMKRCATREDCSGVGCRHRRDTGHTECVSCCEGMICNMETPTNHSNAVLTLRNAHSSSERSLKAWTPSSVLVLLMLAAPVLW